MLEKLKESPKDRILVLITVVISVPFFILTLIFIINEFSLVSMTGYGVLDFELTWTPERMNALLTAWGPIEIENQTILHHIDNFYAPIYGLWGAGCVLIVSRKIEGSIQEIGLFITITPLLAGLFDVLENVNLLLM